MLSLRPSCEHCNKILPPDAKDAMICSYECTFCQRCVEKVLENVCPNCGGGFWQRPVRPKHDLVNGNYLGNHPASTDIVHQAIKVAEHQQFAQKLKLIPPETR